VPYDERRSNDDDKSKSQLPLSDLEIFAIFFADDSDHQLQHLENVMTKKVLQPESRSHYQSLLLMTTSRVFKKIEPNGKLFLHVPEPSQGSGDVTTFTNWALKNHQK
jgi:hypothetical protein